MAIFTGTNVAIGIFVAYISFVGKELYGIMNPQFSLQGQQSLDALWEEGQRLEAQIYLSRFKTWKKSHFQQPDVHHIGSFKDLSFDWKENHRSTTFNISAEDAVGTSQRHANLRQMWTRIRSNETYHVHVHISHENVSPNPSHSSYDEVKVVTQSTAVIKHAARRNLKNSTYLLGHLHPIFDDEPEPLREDPLQEMYSGEDPAITADVVSYWKPEIAIRLVTDFKKYPLKAVPPLVFPHLNIKKKKEPHNGAHKYYYMPIMFVDEMGLTNAKLTALNRTSSHLSVKLSYEPMSFARWQMLLFTEMAIKSQHALGLSENDTDDLRTTVADTNPYLLGITMFVSVLHMLFDFLAFKSDIAFWRSKQSKIGISVRTMCAHFISQIIIFLYLYEEKASLLVLAPSGVSLIIQMWKIIKASGSTISLRSFPYIISLPPPSTQVQSKTSQIDAMAMRYMGFALYPLVIGYSSYSLVYSKHTGWYSWLLKSLTGTVYTFGFIMMTPQLFINYKLKSVAHLPWKFLVYRALNTFIDDLFAFVIHMPTMHRIGCFRDDIIFFIYVYQRWIYPVDKNRLYDTDTEPEPGLNASEKPHKD